MIEKKSPVKSPVKANTINSKPAPLNQPIGHPDKHPLFHKENYVLMLAGLIVIVIGMMIMSGGKSNDPKVFDQKEVYSSGRS